MNGIMKVEGLQNKSIGWKLGTKLRDILNIAPNGSGIDEGRDLEAKSFNLAQMPNRITKD